MPRRSTRTSVWPKVAVALWLVTAFAGGGFWLSHSRGEPAAQVMVPADDAREGIPVTLEERDVTMLVMRQNLESFHELLEAVAAEDRPRVARLARAAVTVPGPGRRMRSLREKLPEGWRAMGQQVKVGYENLADAAETPDGDLVTPLTQTTAVCVACHARYRLDLQP